MRNRRPMPPGKKAGARHGKLPVHGESRFPHQRDPRYRDWIKALNCSVDRVVRNDTRGELAVKGRQPCGDRPERYAIEAAHVLTKGAGNPDCGNLVPLCPAHHDEQEGRTTQFNARYEIDLHQVALDLDAEYSAL